MSSEYELESKISTGSMLPLYISPTLPTLSFSPIDSPLLSHHESIRFTCNYLPTAGAVGSNASVDTSLACSSRRSNGWSRERNSRTYQMEVAKPAIFSGEAGKVGGFIRVCRLYLRMKMREAMVEKQVQWVLSYVQGGSVDV